MYDRIHTIGHSIIQHGPLSRRIYLMKLSPNDLPGIVRTLDELATTSGYTKIFAKVPSSDAGTFLARGYRREAIVPGLYDGTRDGLFMAKYLDESRARDPRDSEMRDILEAAIRKQDQGTGSEARREPSINTVSHADASEMSALYRQVFDSYPFPIHDPDYIRKNMLENIRYFCIREEGRIVSLASAEMDAESRNVEMTDFATLPDHRGSGHAVHLLARMEHEMAAIGIATAYTIARAMSPGMNITFAKLGYRYSGTLINNTNISGAIESMNVWYKHL
jgi:putative beta-lysine N-acetyltransferase